MVGRDKEKSMILDAVAKAKEHEFQAIWLQGEAGFGKSLLLSNCTAEIELSEYDVAFVEASPTEKALPFAIWKKAFAAWLSEDMPPVKEWQAQLSRDVQFLQAVSPFSTPVQLLIFWVFRWSQTKTGRSMGSQEKIGPSLILRP